jgi:DnaJ-class molecular chaperone
MHNPEGKSEEARKLKNNLKGTCILVYMTLRANRIGKAVPRRTTTTRHQVGGAIRGYIIVCCIYAYHRCPKCDGVGFIWKVGATLRVNAARKDQAQIVCAHCNGLGKLNQFDE